MVDAVPGSGGQVDLGILSCDIETSSSCGYRDRMAVVEQNRDRKYHGVESYPTVYFAPRRHYIHHSR